MSELFAKFKVGDPAYLRDGTPVTITEAVFIRDKYLYKHSQSDGLSCLGESLYDSVEWMRITKELDNLPF